MIVCTAKNADKNDSNLNVSEVETDGHITSCQKSNINEVEDGGEEEIRATLTGHNNSDDINIKKDNVDENMMTSSTEKEVKDMNNVPKNIPRNVPKQFKFIYSDEFSRLHQQYLITADSGDVNRLALFLSHNPYHPEGSLFIYNLLIYSPTRSSLNIVKSFKFVSLCAVSLLFCILVKM